MFSLSTLNAQLLRPSKINDIQFAGGVISLEKSLNIEFEDGMRSGWYEVGLSGCWCPFGSSDANQLKDMLDWIYWYFSCVNECYDSFLLTDWYVFSVVFWKQVSDILVVNFYEAEFYLHCCSFWLKLFLFCKDVIEGKIADTFFVFLSENWEGFTWASNSIG